MRRRADSQEVRAFIAGGPEPKVDAYEMAHRDLDGPEECAVHRLAAAIPALIAIYEGPQSRGPDEERRR